MSIIQLKNLTKQYGKKIIFQNLNLDIPASSFTVLRGESGSGKSTLLNLIGGLESPTNGEILVNGKNIQKLSKTARTDFYRHEIGIIFQGSYLQPQFSLLENITLPGIFAGVPETERISRAHSLAEMLGISANLNSLPQEVSGGQAERACIARALLLQPKIILADEPTSNLDETNAQTVLEILDSLRQQMNITVIIASHSHDVLEFATEIVTVKDGTVEITSSQETAHDTPGNL